MSRKEHRADWRERLEGVLLQDGVFLAHVLELFKSQQANSTIRRPRARGRSGSVGWTDRRVLILASLIGRAAGSIGGG